MSFPLKNKKKTGFGYGDKTWYTAHHLGQDYSAKIGDKLYAPFDGEILKNFNGTQGGLTIWFKPKNDNVIMRFMHLSQFKGKVGKVKEGDLIGLTGNTGSATTGQHLHIDISKKQVILTDWKNFIDPEKYKWEEKKKEKKEEVKPIVKPVEQPIEQPKEDFINYEPQPKEPSVAPKLNIFGKAIDLLTKLLKK